MKKEDNIIRKMYFKKWIRIPIKLVISMAISKIVFDFSEHVLKFRRRNPNPRFVYLVWKSANMMINLRQRHLYPCHILGTKHMMNILYFWIDEGFEMLAYNEQRCAKALGWTAWQTLCLCRSPLSIE